MVQWFTLEIKVHKSSHAILRFRFEPWVKHYSCSAQRARQPARYRGSKYNVGKSMHWSDSATSYWQGQVTKPIPTSFKTFFNRAFDLKHSKHNSHVHTDVTSASWENLRFKMQCFVSILSLAIHTEILAMLNKARKPGTSFSCKYGMEQKGTSGSSRKQWLASENMWTARLEHQFITVTSSSLSLSIQPWCPKPDITENPGTTSLGEGKNKAEQRMTAEEEVWNYD